MQAVPDAIAPIAQASAAGELAAAGRRAEVTARLSLDLHDGEVLIKTGWATHFVGRLSDTGRLSLTSRRLIFQAHRISLFGVSGTIPVADVVDFITGRVPVDLTLVLKDGRNERFAVWPRGQWISEIRAASRRARGSS